MKLFHLYNLFFLLLSVSCATAQKTVNESAIKINFSGDPVGTTARITVYFTGGFNDSLLIKQNDTVLIETFFKSDRSTSFTGISKTVDLNNGEELEILELSTGKKILVKLIKGYGIIELSKYSNEWAVLYGNRPPVFE